MQKISKPKVHRQRDLTLQEIYLQYARANSFPPQPGTDEICKLLQMKATVLNYLAATI